MMTVPLPPGHLDVRFLATRTGPDMHVLLTLARAPDVIEHPRLGQVEVTLQTPRRAQLG